VKVEARRRGNHVELAVSDDGRGLDRAKILAKAIQKGLVTPEDAAQKSDQDAFELIFLPGFSTADTVGYVSGRGVGMNIVKEVITAAKGRIVIESALGRFTRFIMIFPLNTAVIDGVLVRVGSTNYVVPVSAVVESIRLTSGRVDTVAGSASVFQLRDETLPIISLHRVLQTRSGAGEPVGVVVENTDKRKFVLLVDEVLTKREVVIKSLGPQFRHLRGVSAGTVTSEALALVLDVDEIIQLSHGASA
jgi:two-component system chemotaxis sensor kinase CheA